MIVQDIDSVEFGCEFVLPKNIHYSCQPTINNVDTAYFDNLEVKKYHLS